MAGGAEEILGKKPAVISTVSSPFLVLPLWLEGLPHTCGHTGSSFQTPGDLLPFPSELFPILVVREVLYSVLFAWGA